MKRENTGYLLFGLALLGALVAGYMLSTRIGKVPLICVTGSDCGIVQASKYAYIFGIPVSGYGFVFYATMLTLSLGFRKNPDLIRWIFPLSVAGILFTGYLTYAQKFLIGTFCFWCIISTITASLLFIVALTLKLQGQKT